MDLHNSGRLKRLLLFSFALIFSLFAAAQDLGRIDQLSDSDLRSYWEQARAQGYTVEQIKALAVSRGLSSEQMARLEQRIGELGLSSDSLEGSEIDNALEITKGEAFGFEGGVIGDGIQEDPLFGYDFFNNQNITFTPNLNLATPKNYQLGPGDELAISLWGAAENSYNKTVDREGAIRIENVGPVYVNGLTIEVATQKIEQRLKRIYAGISAPASSPYKVNVGVALVNVRTVQVNIIGEVKVPGTYSLSALSTVLNALYASGGPTKEGTFREVKLVRNGEEVAVFDIYKYLTAGSQEGNTTVQDQDVIIVAPYSSRIRINGAVKRQGIYELKDSESLADLFKYASGFSSDAYREKVVIERIEGDRKRIKEVLYANAANESMKDGDVVSVRNIIPIYENKLSISGAVYREGNYEYTSGVTLKDLIDKASGVRKEAFLDRGLLFRSDDGIRKTVVPFSVSKVLSGETNIDLQPNDDVRIYNKYALSESPTISIDGAVNNPDSYPFAEDMTIEDLVIIAGGYRRGANPELIDVYRRVEDDNIETLTERFEVTADGSLVGSGGSFALQPGDKVSVRYLKGIFDQKRVTVTGEVNVPGNYSLTTKEQRISDLVDLSAGLTDFAFVDGATLVRKNPYYRADIQRTISEGINDSIGASYEDLNNKMEFRVGIDLGEILAEGGRGSKYDLILEDGDQLIIPSTKQTIKIEGEVLAPTMVRFDDNLTALDYINKSGGFSLNAKKGRTYVIYANGDIAATKNFLFFRTFPKIKPGAVILVPSRPDRNPLTVQEGIGITSGIVTMGLLIDRLLR